MISLFNKFKKQKQLILEILLLLAAYIVFITTFTDIALGVLNSDMSSELILSNLLNQEKGILSTNWFYSTELRVLNTQLVFAPLFNFFESWTNVRIWGTAILIIILLASFLYLASKLKIKHAFIFAIALLCPLSSDYFGMVLAGTYYIPHIAITFISLGLFISIKESDLKHKLTWIKIVSLCFLALIAGLGGLRQLVILYVPMVICSTLYIISYINKHGFTMSKNDFKDIGISLSMLISAGFGYLINAKVLSNLIHFFSYNDVHFTGFSSTSIDSIINGWMNAYGYQSSTPVFSKHLFSNIIFVGIIGLILFSIYTVLKQKAVFNLSELYIIQFFLSAVVFISLLYLFSDMSYEDRYLLPISILFLPVIAIGINSIRHKIAKRILYSAIILGVIYISTTFNLDSNEYIQYEKNNELKIITTEFVSEGYYNGYASFWDANILTELTDGDVEVWCYSLDSNDTMNKNDFFAWLQKTSHSTTNPIGKVFVLLPKSAIEYNSQLENCPIIYLSDQYIAYGFDSDEALQELLPE